ncbi:Ig-like domain-containing protein [Archangium sp.]|jgi:hypothetical protein|uniref:Ig-like domain-containing protein n=1 Tax=Archangium sp. TaxID=1872627 RepID=UPI002ED90147
MGSITYRKLGSSSWTSFLPAVAIVGLLGTHLTAAALGLYSSAPSVSVVEPLTGSSLEGRMQIAVRADDGPMGSGVRGVEFQLDSTSGTWKPLTLDPSSMTYRGTWEAASGTVGHHDLYIRATDYTGNHRTVYVTVNVSASPTRPAGVQVLAPL